MEVHGTVTELELDELAIDLATVINGAPNSNLVVDRMSQSSLDPRVMPFIPATIAGLTGVRAGIETGVARDLTLHVFVRVQDYGERAQKRGEPRWQLPEPAPFTPVSPDQE